MDVYNVAARRDSTEKMKLKPTSSYTRVEAYNYSIVHTAGVFLSQTYTNYTHWPQSSQFDSAILPYKGVACTCNNGSKLGTFDLLR